MRLFLVLLFVVVIAGGAGSILSLSHRLMDTLPGAGPAATARESGNCKLRKRPVVVNLDNRKHWHVLDHAWDAIDAGAPSRLTLERDGADRRREVSTDDVPTARGYDRDEYPPAVSSQGGESADVRYVRSSENRSAGAVMGAQLRRFCDGQRFRYEHRP